MAAQGFKMTLDESVCRFRLHFLEPGRTEEAFHNISYNVYFFDKLSTYSTSRIDDDRYGMIIAYSNSI